MMTANIERLAGRAVVDRRFRQQLLADPEGAAKSAGVALSPAELEQVRKAAARFAGSETNAKSFDVLRGGAWA